MNGTYRIILGYLLRKSNDLGFNKFLKDKKELYGPLGERMKKIEKPKPLNWEDPADIRDKVKSGDLSKKEARDSFIQLCKDDETNKKYIKNFVQLGVLNGDEPIEYNDYKNYATWNIIFHVAQNEEFVGIIRKLVLREKFSYSNFLDEADLWHKKTPDGVSYGLGNLDEATIETELEGV